MSEVVIQPDRIAAASAIGPGYSLDRASVLAGASDKHRIVQSFARHRRESVEPVCHVLGEILDLLRREAPGTALNNHRFTGLGIKANAVLDKALAGLRRERRCTGCGRTNPPGGFISASVDYCRSCRECDEQDFREAGE